MQKERSLALIKSKASLPTPLMRIDRERTRIYLPGILRLGPDLAFPKRLPAGKREERQQAVR
jgi:hypothetical protein